MVQITPLLWESMQEEQGEPLGDRKNFNIIP